MALARSRRDSGMNYWPGFVDALSTLVLSIIFLLTVFMVAQFYLSQQIFGQDPAMAQLLLSLAATSGERDRLRNPAEGAQSGADDGKAEAGRLNSQLDIEKAATWRAVAQIEIRKQQSSALRRQIAA